MIVDDPSEETITKTSQIKEQHETMKLIAEEVRMLQQKHLN